MGARLKRKEIARMTPPGVEPAAERLVAQQLGQPRCVTGGELPERVGVLTGIAFSDDGCSPDGSQGLLGQGVHTQR